MLYTDDLAGALTWQWPEGSEGAKSACGPRIVQLSTCVASEAGSYLSNCHRTPAGFGFLGDLFSKCLEADGRSLNRAPPGVRRADLTRVESALFGDSLCISGSAEKVTPSYWLWLRAWCVPDYSDSFIPTHCPDFCETSEQTT